MALLRLALRNLARNRRRTALTVMALAIGVAALTGARGFLNGLQNTLIGGVTEGGIGAIQVHRAGFLASRDVMPLSPGIVDHAAIIERLRALPRVRNVAARVPFAGIVADKGGDRSALAIMLATDLTAEADVSRTRAAQLINGRWPTAEGEAAISAELARALSINVGDDVSLLSNDQDGVLNGVSAIIVGTLAAPTMAEKKLVVLSLAKGQELLRLTHITELAVAIDDDADVDIVAARVRDSVGPAHEVHTWRALMPFADDARYLQDAVLSIVTLAFLVVVLTGVANSLLMNVLERTREIGTLLALGMKRRQVLSLFLVEGALVGALGVIVGSIIGNIVVATLGVHGVYLNTAGASLAQLIVPTVSLRFSAALFVIVVLGAVLASLIPALRGSRLDPVAALTDR